MKTSNLILLDTNIVNFILLDSPELQNYAWILNGKRYALSFATIAELVLWKMVEMEKSDQLLFRDAMEKLNNFILDCIIFESSPSISYRAATLAFKYRKKRQKENNQSESDEFKMRFNKRWHDWWIGATAIEHKLDLVTHNVKDFKYIKDIINIIGPDSKPPNLLI